MNKIFEEIGHIPIGKLTKLSDKKLSSLLNKANDNYYCAGKMKEWIESIIKT